MMPPRTATGSDTLGNIAPQVGLRVSALRGLS